jgi:prevent-host-death family protein
MRRVVSATEARIRFGELMRQAVENHETIVVERGGKSHVVVMSVEEYERLLKRQQQDDWKELVHGARSRIQAELGDRTLPRPEDILDQVRKGRDEQLLGMR